MNTVVKKFALVALCTTALTAVSQTSQAASVLFDISGGTVPVFTYSNAVGSDNVVNDSSGALTWNPLWTTGSTVYDPSSTAAWKGSTTAINSVLSVSGLLANQQYNVAFTYAGSEAGNNNQFSVASAGNVLTNGAIATSTSGINLNSNYNGNPQVGSTVSMGSVTYVNTGAGGNTPGFTITDTTNAALFPANTTTNGGTNSVPNNGASSLIFSYANFDGANYTLTTTATDYVVFGFNDNGAGDDNHDDFVGILSLTPGKLQPGNTPIPGALPLFGSVLGGGFLFRKLRKRRQAKAQIAAV